MSRLPAIFGLGCLVSAVLLLAAAATCLLEDHNRAALLLLVAALPLLALSRLGRGKSGR